MVVGRVSMLRRYPVKSLRGEQLTHALLDDRGIEGDRELAIEGSEGEILSARRVPRLLDARARRTAGGVVLELPGGVIVPADRADEQLSAWLERPVRLRTPAEGLRPVIADTDGSFRGRAGSFFDAAPVHLITTATLATLGRLAPGSRFDARRFRPNIVLDTDEAAGAPEQDWIGRKLMIGSATLTVRGPCRRCVMTTLPQEDLPRDRRILATVARETANTAGVYALVTGPGEIALGDPASLEGA